MGRGESSRENLDALAQSPRYVHGVDSIAAETVAASMHEPWKPLVALPLGAPGAGKGTQSKLLSKKTGYPHVSTGDILRAESERDTPRGQALRTSLAAGQFTPDDEMLEIILDRLAEPDVAQGIILDGYPRNLGQADAFEQIARRAGFAPPLAIELVISDEAAVERVLARSGNRSDDTPEVIRERLRIYHERTAPLTNFYRVRGRLVSLDGERPVSEVAADIEAAVASVLARDAA